MPSDKAPKTEKPVTPRAWSDLPRRAWVTGAGKGIGRGVARALAADGWTVFVSARTEKDLDSLAAGASSLTGVIRSLPLDVTDGAACKAALDEILADGEPLGLIVFNAGTHKPTPVEDFEPDDLRMLTEVNIMGAVNGLAPAMSHFRNQGFGKIAVVASVAGYQGLPKAAGYCATKAALIALCESLYPELRRDGVSLQVINPGFVKTPLTDKNDFPMPFLMEVDDAVARIMSGLASDRFEIAFPTRFVLILKFLKLLPYRAYFALTGRMVA
jgi:NAD(P)-dependent dehydrogenase (short-subunit alcohol dehydrogenase family)